MFPCLWMAWNMKHTDLMMRLSTKASHGPCLPPNLMSSLQTIQGKMNKLNDTMKESESVSCSVTSDSLRPHGLQPARFLCPWNSPGKNTRLRCHALLQGIFPTQRSNPGLLYCRQIFYHLSHHLNAAGDTFFRTNGPCTTTSQRHRKETGPVGGGPGAVWRQYCFRP